MVAPLLTVNPTASALRRPRLLPHNGDSLKDEKGKGKFNMHFTEHEKTKRSPLVICHVVIQLGVQFKNNSAFYGKRIKDNFSLNLAQEGEFRRTWFPEKGS